MNNDRCNLNCNKVQDDYGYCTILFAEYEDICPCEECVIKMMCTKNCKEYNAVIQHCGRLTISKYDILPAFLNMRAYAFPVMFL